MHATINPSNIPGKRDKNVTRWSYCDSDVSNDTSLAKHEFLLLSLLNKKEKKNLMNINKVSPLEECYTGVQ